MEWSPSEMIQQAKEELELLETHHPNRFQYLKLDLKAFILLLQSQQPSSSTVTVATQGHLTIIRCIYNYEPHYVFISS
ncbi:hypothetical protein SLEP1_g30494 [Rubroshorea leprosula]|uniref:Uncharacterized protein n=1 Tax=Rubroshorea leprosula TaxID=152421 RepID=A0AAV5K7V9_9ROSI|nr:hypothetical protein SLEP1_g30494 [Rubroshorea leprosula]